MQGEDRSDGQPVRDSDGSAPPETTNGPIEGVPLDRMYDVLRNRRRRLVLHYLVNAPEHEAVLKTLATQVAAWENDVPLSAVSSKLRKRTYNGLQQTHLPMMDEAGVIEYDHDRGTVALAVRPERIELFLTVLPRTGTVWTKGFLLAGVVLWAILALNWLAVHVFDLYRSGSAAVISALTLVLVLVGLLHVYRVFR